MKKYIKSMGVIIPAHNVSAHDAYSPSIDITTFTQLLKSATASNNAMLVNGMITQVIADINSDNAAGNVNNQNIRNYYRRYYNAVNNCPVANVNLVNQLHNLV